MSRIAPYIFILSTLPLVSTMASDTSSNAADLNQKYIGTWQGISGTSIYTKMIVHSQSDITYCYVQSCRQQNCWRWTISGDTEAKFSYKNVSGLWEFERLSQESIEGTFTNAAGETSFVYYNPQ